MSDRKRVVLCGSVKGNTERFKEFSHSVDINTDDYSVSMPPLFNYDSLKNETIVVCKMDLYPCKGKNEGTYCCRHEKNITHCSERYKNGYSAVKEFLNEQHIKKIEKADLVIVLNYDKIPCDTCGKWKEGCVHERGIINGNLSTCYIRTPNEPRINYYIGGNTFVEICSAIFMNKPIYLLNPIPYGLIYTDVLTTWEEVGKIQKWDCYFCIAKEPQFEDCGIYCKKMKK